LQSADAKYPVDWTADGKYLLYQQSSDSDSKSGLYVVPTSGAEQPRQLVGFPLYTADGSLSPDGRWVVYSSQQQGTNRIFLSPFSGSAPRVQVSFDQGAHEPRWRKDGKAIIYNCDDGYLKETEVYFRNGEPSLGATRTLFRASAELVPQAGQTYDLAPDGHFIVDVRGQESNSQIVVISNWNTGLRN
jgi:Tol biopolymer transport system component